MNKSHADIHEDGSDGWVWCYICHRCYPREEAVVHDGEQMCAYFPECDGSLWRDGWAWSHVLARFRRIVAELPDIPERDTAYLQSLFPRSLGR